MKKVNVEKVEQYYGELLSKRNVCEEKAKSIVNNIPDLSGEVKEDVLKTLVAEYANNVNKEIDFLNQFMVEIEEEGE